MPLSLNDPIDGAELKQLFDPACPNTTDLEGREEVRGRQLLIYGFRAEPGGCFETFTPHAGGKTYNPARTGRALVDDPGGNLIQFEEEVSGFPKGSGLVESKKSVSWDTVRIGDDSYLLPVAGDYVFVLSPKEVWHITVEYTHHRHFEASTNVTFR